MADRGLQVLDLLVLDENFMPCYNVDQYTSLIWTDRYCQAGDFELICPVTDELMAALVKDRYLYNSKSEHLMVIDDLTVTSDAELGYTFKIKGYSLEYLLTRRTIEGTVTMVGNLMSLLETKVFNPNLFSPSKANRKIPNLEYAKPTDSSINSLKIDYDQQFVGTSIYELLVEILPKFDLGFKITLSEENKMVLQIYKGEDRSFDQTKNNFVIFAPNYDNLLSSNYYDSNHDSKTTVYAEGVYDYDLVITAHSVTKKVVTEYGTFYVTTTTTTTYDESTRTSSSRTTSTSSLEGSEGEATEESTVHKEETRSVYIGDEKSGLDRRELYVDGNSIQSKVDDVTILRTEYDAALRSLATNQLKENKPTTLFEGEIDSNTMFIYGEDFFIGDLVQIRNEYGHEAKCRVSEMVFSHGTDGYTAVPTFSSISEDEEENKQ